MNIAPILFGALALVVAILGWARPSVAARGDGQTLDAEAPAVRCKQQGGVGATHPESYSDFGEVPGIKRFVAVEVLHTLGARNFALGNRESALAFHRRALDIEDADLARTAVVADEPCLFARASATLASTYYMLTLHLQTAPDHPGVAKLALTALLRRKRRTRDLLARAFVEPATIAAIQAALPCKSVLIEYVSYVPTARDIAGFTPTQKDPNYAVYIVFSDHIEWVDLGPTGPIHEFVHEFRKSLALEREDVVDRARALYTLVMRPVIGRLGREDRQLFVAPDGELELIPFGALHDGRRYLIESHGLRLIGTGRDLLRPWDSERIADGPTVVVANPKGANLPGTEAAGATLKDLFDDAHILTGGDATEARVTKIVRPHLLHIGTHGVSESRASGEAPWQGVGLALADAGVSSTAQHREDGILRAHEIGGWDLEGTELVTLSACESGLGMVAPGEGVLGHRRALEIAGAQTQIVGLWSISDGATAALWDAYYPRLAAGEGRQQAMQNAQLEMLRNRNHSHPFYWGAFVTSGEWRPLSRPGESEPPSVSRCGCRASIGGPDDGGHAGLLLLLLLAHRRRWLPSGCRKTLTEACEARHESIDFGRTRDTNSPSTSMNSK